MTEQKELKVEEIKKAAEERKCPVQRSLFYIEGFLEGPMCGRCFPCALGSYEAKVRLKKVIQGRGGEFDLRVIRRISEDMLVSSRCKKGKDTATFLLEWLNTDVFDKHVEGSCPDMECKALNTGSFLRSAPCAASVRRRADTLRSMVRRGSPLRQDTFPSRSARRGA